ncbi:hypothetical protein XOC_1954 [Xanthomonas oryzae pv. oryzicola BLS256]|uniref:Uncharacterized protein n=1 Tax=Xanthomonas oryzae pv. oryzicola (strain BLS256) TaxID=383407 RepID=G7TBN6_XANOB|nr:hypothetical protein XOC_1954 [Xanthomonas oryzae pv. oryzicola BLS256]
MGAQRGERDKDGHGASPSIVEFPFYYRQKIGVWQRESGQEVRYFRRFAETNAQ